MTNFLKSAIQEEKEKIEKCEVSIKTISNYLNELDNNSALISNRKTEAHKKLQETWNEVSYLFILGENDEFSYL